VELGVVILVCAALLWCCFLLDRWLNEGHAQLDEKRSVHQLPIGRLPSGFELAPKQPGDIESQAYNDEPSQWTNIRHVVPKRRRSFFWRSGRRWDNLRREARKRILNARPDDVVRPVGAAITRETMFAPLLEADPSFEPVWTEFLAYWSGEPLPLYLALSDLGRHLDDQLNTDRTERFPEIFSVVECWHVLGDDYVREAATKGLLESIMPEEAYLYWLGPESQKAWFGLAASHGYARKSEEVISEARWEEQCAARPGREPLLEISRAEQETTDFDWFCIDERGELGHFTSAGLLLPPSVAQSSGDLLFIKNYFLKLEKNRGANWKLRGRSDYIEMAERGLYSYDVDLKNDSWLYHRVAMPDAPLTVQELPEEVARVVRRTILRGQLLSASERIEYEKTLEM
jgi:hypothetical protein